MYRYMVGCHATGLLYLSIVVSILGKYTYITLVSEVVRDFGNGGRGGGGGGV